MPLIVTDDAPLTLQVKVLDCPAVIELGVATKFVIPGVAVGGMELPPPQPNIRDAKNIAKQKERVLAFALRLQAIKSCLPPRR